LRAVDNFVTVPHIELPSSSQSAVANVETESTGQYRTK
jgi:hypothetical protein